MRKTGHPQNQKQKKACHEVFSNRLLKKFPSLVIASLSATPEDGVAICESELNPVNPVHPVKKNGQDNRMNRIESEVHSLKFHSSLEYFFRTNSFRASGNSGSAFVVAFHRRANSFFTVEAWSEMFRTKS